jgi:hypothetical protein
VHPQSELVESQCLLFEAALRDPQAEDSFFVFIPYNHQYLVDSSMNISTCLYPSNDVSNVESATNHDADPNSGFKLGFSEVLLSYRMYFINFSGTLTSVFSMSSSDSAVFWLLFGIADNSRGEQL